MSTAISNRQDDDYEHGVVRDRGGLGLDETAARLGHQALDLADDVLTSSTSAKVKMAK